MRTSKKARSNRTDPSKWIDQSRTSVCDSHVKTKLIVVLLSTLPCLGFAQFSEFRITNAEISFGTIQASGAAAQHILTVSITNTNGSIRGTGTRYSVASNAVSPSPTNGTAVTVLTNSRLGLPIFRTTNFYRFTNDFPNPPNFTNSRKVVTTNTYIESSCAAAIWLSDGAKLKGFVSQNVSIDQMWDSYSNRYTTNRTTNHYGQLQATYSNGFGTGVNWSTWSESSGGGGASQ